MRFAKRVLRLGLPAAVMGLQQIQCVRSHLKNRCAQGLKKIELNRFTALNQVYLANRPLKNELNGSCGCHIEESILTAFATCFTTNTLQRPRCKEPRAR